MNTEQKSYRVDIFGDQYALVTDELQERVEQAAALVDQLMKEIADKAQSMDTKRVAVLVALQMASKMLSLKETAKQDEQYKRSLARSLDEVLASISL